MVSSLNCKTTSMNQKIIPFLRVQISFQRIQTGLYICDKIELKGML